MALFRRRGVLAAILTLLNSTAIAAAACPSELGPEVRVARVIDGETVALDDGAEVRLVNIVPSEGRGEAARGALRQLLAAGGRAQLALSGRERDRRGRWLAQLYLLRGGGRLWVQGDLIGRGVARAYSLADTRACMRELQALEARARANRLGLWSDPETAVLPAWQTRAILRRRNAFAIVEGRVHTVAATRKWTFINFEADWRRDFTIAIAAADRRLFDGSDVRLDGIEGMRLRVRGWVESWNGPVIKATHPEQIETLSAGR